MSKKELPPRFHKYWHDKPVKPEPGSTKFKIELVTATSERYNHFRNTVNERYAEDEEEDSEEFTGKLSNRQSLSLKEINKLVKKHNLDEGKVFFTASFADDYLVLEAVHIKKMDDASQLKEYEESHVAWEKQQADRLEDEAQRIDREMKNLQYRAEQLKKKKV